MSDVMIISGAPGSGKTTISQILKKLLGDSPLIDFGQIRQFHLNMNWSNESILEEQMSFENLIAIINNYKKYGFSNVIINDLQDNRVQQIPALLENLSYQIFSLVVDDNVLKERIQNPLRDSGFKNIQAALLWNNELKNRKTLSNEYKINNSHSNPEKTATEIYELITGNKQI